jgi:phosphogluconate dehydratase
MLMEIMGLHLPGASFVNPNTPLRDALTELGARRALELTAAGNGFTPIGHVIDERAIVNGVVGLHATGGSTNHTIHLIAMAAAAGVQLGWDDFADLAEVTPLLTRIYPNGKADVNHFQAAGGMPVLIRELLGDGLLHADVRTVWGEGLGDYVVEPVLAEGGAVAWREAAAASCDESVLRGAAKPFQPTGGLRVLEGPLGRAVIKTSAVAAERHVIEAPARVFHSQEELHVAFRAGELFRDVVVVVRFQGPQANGMPELHKLMPPLGIAQDRGHKVALVTDGRLSGASGKVPAAIHVTPEAAAGGEIGKIRDGDIIRVDAVEGRLEVRVDPKEWASRSCVKADLSANHFGIGRDLFSAFRAGVGRADQGASIFAA